MRHFSSRLARLLTPLSIFLVATTLGCTGAVKISESNREPSYKKTISRLYVISALADVDEPFAESFEQGFQQLLAEHNIEVSIVALTGLELDPDGLLKKGVEDFQPDAILGVRFVSVYSGNLGSWEGMTEIRLYEDLEADTGSVFVSQIYIGPVTAVVDSDLTAKKFAKVLVEQLKEEGLLANHGV